MSIRDITLGRYVYGESILHRLDPRTKLISLLVLMTGLFAGNAWTAVAVTTGYTVIAMALSGLRVSYILRSLMPFKWLIIIAVFINMLFVGGHIVIEAPLPYGGITSEGISNGLLYGSRIAILVLAASIMSLTTEPIVLVDGIEKLLMPFRRIGLHPQEIATAMVITIRFIPILLDEAEKIRKSHLARGFRPDRGIRTRIRSASLMLMPLFTSAVFRAEHLATAMECRLYRPGAERTRLREISMTSADWLALALTLIVTLAMVLL